jgi:hypothetical protein
VWDEPTLNERRADSAVPATASSGGATVLTKAELPVMDSGHELGVVNSAVYAGAAKSPTHDGECLEDLVTESGEYIPGDAPGPTLKKFFSRLYGSCGLSRGDWQDAQIKGHRSCHGVMSDWPNEETNEPLLADDRNFYKVENCAHSTITKVTIARRRYVFDGPWRREAAAGHLCVFN